MEKNNPNIIAEKYIPPHRRKQLNTELQIDLCATNIPSNEIVTTNAHANCYTVHAKVRKAQRNIKTKAINQALEAGNKLEAEESTTYINETTQVVMAKNGKVITVNDNLRNTNFTLQNKTKQREQHLLEQVKTKCNDSAMCELAELYLKGNLGNREPQKAHDLFLRAANEKSNSHAMCMLAEIYEKGDLGYKDTKKAFEWLEKAAERNNKYANAILGQRLLDEFLAKKDKAEENVEEVKLLIQKAMRCFERSARKGSTRAMWHIAKIYEEGWLGEKDLNQAISIYSNAAKTGSPNSLRKLYRLVKEEKFNAEEFEAILDIACHHIARTSIELAVDIGLEQIEGELGNNAQRGIWLIEKAAEKGNPRAASVLAKCYRDGKGTEANIERSQYWFLQLKKLYERAADKGNVIAMLDLGELYLKGSFGKIDLNHAEKMFTQAALQKDIDAIFYLGTLYLDGRLGDKDPELGMPLIEKAIELWSVRAEKGDVNAALSLVDIYLDKDLGFKNYEKAITWLIFAASCGNVDAFLQSIKIFYKEKILKDNPIKIEKIILNANAKEEKSKKAEIFFEILSLIIKVYYGFTSDETIKSESMQQLTKKLILILEIIGETKPEAHLLLIKLIIKGNLIIKNTLLATKLLYTLTGISRTDVFDQKVDNYFDKLLNNMNWSAEDKLQIMQTLLDIAKKSKRQKPFRIGRILGDIYRKGKLTTVDYKKAFLWYGIAAEQGNSTAMYYLGKLYQENKLDVKDLSKAIDYYITSAQQKNEKAIDALTRLYLTENLSEQYKVKIEQWDKEYKSLDPKNLNKQQAFSDALSTWPKTAIARYKLGKKYLTDSKDEIKDPIKAAFWFRKAAYKDNTKATFKLGQLYYSGQLGEKNRIIAIDHFKAAARDKYLPAIQMLIEIYKDEMLIKSNSGKAIKWQARADELAIESKK